MEVGPRDGRPVTEDFEEDRLDGSRDFHESGTRDDDGRFDSHPVHDDYGDESDP